MVSAFMAGLRRARGLNELASYSSYRIMVYAVKRYFAVVVYFG